MIAMMQSSSPLMVHGPGLVMMKGEGQRGGGAEVCVSNTCNFACLNGGGTRVVILYTICGVASPIRVESYDMFTPRRHTKAGVQKLGQV